MRKRTVWFHFNSFYQRNLSAMPTSIMIAIYRPFFTKHFKMLTGMHITAVCIILFISAVNHPNMHMDTSTLKETEKSGENTVST